MKIASIDRTLNKYGNLSASELVGLTHKKDSPWTVVEEKNWMWYHQVISDEVIEKYHKNEEIAE